MKNKKFLIILSVILLFFMIGCSNQTDDNNLTDEPTVDKIHVSFKSNAVSENNNTTENNSNMKALVNRDDLVKIDQSLYKDIYKNGNKGELVNSYTPDKFIVGLSRMEVYDRDYGRKPVLPDIGVKREKGSGFGIPINLDMVYSKNFLQTSYLHEYGNMSYEGIEMIIWAETLLDGGTYDDSFPIISEIHIDLGETYSGITFDNEVTEPVLSVENNNIHVFELKDLIPFKDIDNSTMEVYILFDNSISERMILNPNGERLDFYNPYFFDQDWTRVNNDGYVMYYPTERLDFSGGNKELVFEWDLNGLIEIYNNGTKNDKSDDLVTLKLSNPFPVSFEMQSYSEKDSYRSTESIKEVSNLKINHYDYDYSGEQVILKWINPAHTDFKQVHIIRKENKIPKNIDDGKMVYNNSFPIFIDKEVEANKTYYYRVFVEDNSDNITSGKIINIDT